MRKLLFLGQRYLDVNTLFLIDLESLSYSLKRLQFAHVKYTTSYVSLEELVIKQAYDVYERHIGTFDGKFLYSLPGRIVLRLDGIEAIQSAF